MQELTKLLISILILFLGVPIGNILRKYTKEEMNQGKKWFRYLVMFSLFGGFIGLVIGKDWIMFSSFFIAIVTSRSLVLKK